MAAAIIRPLWEAPLGRFRDLITGRFVSAASAVPFLRAYPSVRGLHDVVIRDTLGRFVPSRYFGGNVLAHFPSGFGNYGVVTRALPGLPEDFLYRARDVMHGLVHYRIEGGELEEVWVTMPKGIVYDQAIFEDRFASRIVKRDPETYGMIEPVPEYEIEDVEWTVNTYYVEGAYLGEDISRFGGLQ